MKSKYLWLSLAVLMVCGSAVADVINFESDALGGKPNGWSSADSALVTFTDSVGSGLAIYDGPEADGRSLGVWDDYDGSVLIMDFAMDMGSLSLTFGNDDPAWIDAGAFAGLTLYNNGSQVGHVEVVANRNDIMDQSIAYSGACFDQAVFGYYNRDGSIAGLIEIVDNIEFTPCDNIVPEPATMSLLGLALAGMASRRYLRRR